MGKKHCWLSTPVFVSSVLILFLVLAGCSKETKSPASGKKELRFAAWGGATERKIWQTQIQGFENNHPNIKVTLELISDGYENKIKIMAAGRTLPDVFWMPFDSELFLQYITKDVLLDLSSYVERDEEFDIKDFYSQSMERVKYDGKIYGLPMNLGTLALYYNKTMFDEARVPYPDPKEPMTWQELLEVARKLTRDIDNDGRMDEYGLVLDNGRIELFIFQNAGSIYSREGTKCVINSPEAVEGIEFFVDMVYKHKVATLANTPGAESGHLFKTGKVGMCIANMAIGAWCRDVKDFCWDVAPLPKGKIRAGYIFLDGPVISRWTKHPFEAYELAKYIVSKEGQETQAKMGIGQPSRRSVSGIDWFRNPEEPPENIKVFFDEVDYVMPRTIFLGFAETQAIIMRELEFLLTPEGKGKSVKLICDVVAAKVNKLLEEQN